MMSRMVTIGASLGGMRAVEVLLKGLPADLPASVVVVLHRSADSGEMLRSTLQRSSLLRVREAHDKESIRPGLVYLAPADYHLLIDGGTFALSTEGPVSYARPSLDVLFESAADAYGKQVIGVVLTGANRDGARGAARIKARGGMVLVQEPATAECAIMPEAAIEEAAVDRVLPLTEVAPFLARLCAGTENSRPCPLR